MKQKWFCHNCEASGVTEVEKKEDVWSVINKIASQHAKASSVCDTGIMLIRLEKSTRRKKP